MMRSVLLAMLAISLSSTVLAQPPTASSRAPDSRATDSRATDSKAADTPTADPNVFHDKNGNSCTPGKGETICPALKPDSVNLPSIQDLWRKDQTAVLEMDYCVSGAGAPDSIVVAKSSGVDEVDRRFQRSLETWRFQPGTVAGKPTRLCGLNVSMKLHFD